MLNKRQHLQAGQHAEQCAAEYLQQQGLRCLHRNYRCRRGEIDLVMYDSTALIFVEVRHRGSKHYGGALASITYQKQHRLIKAAQEYMLRERVHHQQVCRFDIITIDGNLSRPQIDWIRNAFDLSYRGR